MIKFKMAMLGYDLVNCRKILLTIEREIERERGRFLSGNEFRSLEIAF